MSDKKPLKYSHSHAAPSKRRAFQIMDGVWSVKLWPSNTVDTGNTALGAEALVANTEGERNTATGFDALFLNTIH